MKTQKLTGVMYSYEYRNKKTYNSEVKYDPFNHSLSIILKAGAVSNKFDLQDAYLIYSQNNNDIDKMALVFFYGDKNGNEKNSGHHKYNLLGECKFQLPVSLVVKNTKVQLYFHNDNDEKNIAKLLPKFEVILDEYPYRHFTSNQLQCLLNNIDLNDPARPNIINLISILENRYLDDMFGSDTLFCEDSPLIFKGKEPDQSNGGVVIRLSDHP